MISKIYQSYPEVDFYGVAVYDKAIHYTKKHYSHIRFQIAKAEKLPFKKGSFDLIVSYETIEHVEDTVKFLKEVKRALRRNGTSILAMDSGSLLFRVVWHA